MTDHHSVIREKRGQAFWITINRPDKRNALNGDVIAGIARGYRDAHDDKDVRVIVLTGAGDKAFCAGADLQNSGAAFAMDFSRPNVDYADLLRLSQNATKPAIARVGGVCMAGGMGLLCMTDMAVAADHVIFGLPEVKVGVFPMQVMSLLQSIAPPRLVNEWALTGEPFDAKAALAAGLLNYVVPAAELDAKVDWLISRIVDKSPTAIRRGKYAMRAIASMSFDESIAYTESQIALLAMTEDAKEGLKAFGEKRKPTWPGVAPLHKALVVAPLGYRFAFRPGGFDAGDRADLVIVGRVAADADRAEQRAPSWISTPPGTGTSRPCAIVFTASMK